MNTSKLYFVRLHGDHGFTPADPPCHTLDEAKELAAKKLAANSYFHGATIMHQKQAVATVKPS